MWFPVWVHLLYNMASLTFFLFNVIVRKIQQNITVHNWLISVFYKRAGLKDKFGEYKQKCGVTHFHSRVRTRVDELLSARTSTSHFTGSFWFVSPTLSQAQSRSEPSRPFTDRGGLSVKPNPVEPGLFGVVLIRDGVHGAAAAAVVQEEAAAGRHRAAERRDRGQPEFTVAHGKQNHPEGLWVIKTFHIDCKCAMICQQIRFNGALTSIMTFNVVDSRLFVDKDQIIAISDKDDS